MQDWERNFRRKVERLKANEAFDGSARKQVTDYLRAKEGQGVEYHRLQRMADFLWHLLETHNMDFTALTQDQINDLAIWINGNQEWKEWTKYSYTSILRNFLDWLNEQYDLGLRIRIRRRAPKNSLMPEYLLSEDEIRRLINASADAQTRLLLGIVYESGARIGEILTLRLQNISFNTYGARLSVKGKTGQRIIPIIWYANQLRQFMESHPDKDNPEANLWFTRENGLVKPLAYGAVRMRLNRLCEEAGIRKRVHFHLFRHTRLTELASDIPEQTLKALAGWSGDSKMARTYIHLSNKDVEESLLSKVYGIRTDDGNGKEKLRICPRCSEPNPYFAKLCQRCKTPLDEKELAHEIMSEDKMKEVENWSKVFMSFLKAVEKKHPDIWEDMNEIMNSGLVRSQSDSAGTGPT